MCLSGRRWGSKVTGRNPIIGYKVMERVNGGYQPLFEMADQTLINKGKRYTSKNTRSEWDNNYNRTEVPYGFHAFTNLAAAQMFQKFIKIDCVKSESWGDDARRWSLRNGINPNNVVIVKVKMYGDVGYGGIYQRHYGLNIAAGIDSTKLLISGEVK